jgi:hypothetical protein
MSPRRSREQQLETARSSALRLRTGHPRRWALCGVLAVALLIGAAMAAASSGRYRGRTSQQQVVSFTLSPTQVTGFHLTILERCPDGHTLRVHSKYPPMSVRNRKFGGAFVPRHAAPGERAQLRGRVRATRVTGTLKDTSRSKNERALCHGSLTFSARHV